MTKLEKLKEDVSKILETIPCNEEGRGLSLFKEDTFENLVFNMQEDYSDFSACTVTIHGGNNGRPNWTSYLKDIATVIEKLEDIYGKSEVIIEEVKTDVPDDVFDFKVVVFMDK